MKAIPCREREEILARYRKGDTFDAIVKETGRSKWTIARYIKQAGLNRGVGISNRKLTLDESFFDQVDAPVKAYWLGFLAADADVADRGRLTVSLGRKDASHLEALRLSLESSKEVKPHQKTNSRLTIDSVRLVRRLIELGVTPRKSHTATPWQGPDELLRHYYRGLVDGDGCISKKGHLSLVGSHAVTEGFHQFIQQALGFHGLHRPLKTIWETKYWRIAEVAEIARLLYDGLGDAPALTRKLLLAQQAIERKPKLNSWMHLTAQDLLALKTQHVKWGKVAEALGIKSYCVLWTIRKRLGI